MGPMDLWFKLRRVSNICSAVASATGNNVVSSSFLCELLNFFHKKQHCHSLTGQRVLSIKEQLWMGVHGVFQQHTMLIYALWYEHL